MQWGVRMDSGQEGRGQGSDAGSFTRAGSLCEAGGAAGPPPLCFLPAIEKTDRIVMGLPMMVAQVEGVMSGSWRHTVTMASVVSPPREWPMTPMRFRSRMEPCRIWWRRGGAGD